MLYRLYLRANGQCPGLGPLESALSDELKHLFRENTNATTAVVHSICKKLFFTEPDFYKKETDFIIIQALMISCLSEDNSFKPVSEFRHNSVILLHVCRLVTLHEIITTKPNNPK